MSSAPAPSAPVPQNPTAAMADERSGLRKIMWFGILQLCGLVAGWVGGFLFVGEAFSSLTPFQTGQNPTPSQVSATLGLLFRGLSLLVPLVVAIQIAALGILFVSFRKLKAVDGRFAAPSAFTVLELAGTLLVVAPAFLLFSDLPNLIAQIPSTQGTAPPSPVFATAMASVVGYLALFLVGGILAFIGLIGGQILGIWRAGSKYNETLLKLGAIFVIIPFLNIVAPVLVMVGANSARNRLPSGH